MPTPHDMLSTWLDYLGSIHSSAIDMGLTRVRPVFDKLELGLDGQAKKPFVFMVAGTNGKGSTTATIAEMCQQAGLKTALYQSPHLVSFNERIGLDGEQVDDKTLIEAFVAVEAARTACGLSLSFFEITTLATLVVFARANCDVWVLEVGLGGRLDVVNLVTPDVCVITNVAIDHVDWLGDTREKIGFEKAGILRPHSMLIYGESDMPLSVRQAIDGLQVVCHQYSESYNWQDNAQNSECSATADTWTYSGKSCMLVLPKPKLSLQNVSTAVTAVLASGLNVSFSAMVRAMETVQLAGRFDRRQIHGREWLFDVAHNGAGVQFLLEQFVPLWRAYQQAVPNARLLVLFSMLGDKDINEVLSLVTAQNLAIDSWHIATLNNPRAASVETLLTALQAVGVNHIVCHQSIAQATEGVLSASGERDFVLVFGSFHTIGESLQALGQYRGFVAVH